MKFLYVSETDIVEKKKHLDQLWSNVQSIPDTRKAHYFKSVSPYKIQFSMTARGSSAKIFDFQTGELTDVNPMPNVECRATDFKIQD